MSYTGTTFQALIAAHLDRDDLTTKIATFCALAVQELEDNCFWFQLAATTVSTANATDYAAFPTGFIKEVKDGFRDTAGVSLRKETWEQIDYWQTYSKGTGLPDYYAVADKFYFYPIPDAIYAMPLQYYKSIGFPGASATNAWTDTVWDLTFWATMKQAWNYLDNQANQIKCEREISKRLMEYKSRSGKLTGKGTVKYRDF